MTKSYAGKKPCLLSLEQVIDLYVDYCFRMKAAFPGVSIGFTEELRAFNLIGLDGAVYPSSDPTNINMDFETVIRLVTAKAAKRGVTIDYFVLDGGELGSCYIIGRC